MLQNKEKIVEENIKGGENIKLFCEFLQWGYDIDNYNNK